MVFYFTQYYKVQFKHIQYTLVYTTMTRGHHLDLRPLFQTDCILLICFICLTGSL